MDDAERRLKRQKELQEYRQLVDLEATELITENRKEELRPEETVFAEESGDKKKDKHKKDTKGKKGRLPVFLIVAVLAVCSVLLGWRLVILWEDNRELQTLLKNEQESLAQDAQASQGEIQAADAAAISAGDSAPVGEAAEGAGMPSVSGAGLPEETAATEEQMKEENYPGAYPLRGSAIILKPFGVEQDEDGNETECQGVDFEADEGTQVVAAGAGKVIAAGEDGENGYTVRIDHGNGYVSEYLFLSEPEVQAGDQVTKEQNIAAVGANRQKDGAWHLEFRILKDGEYVDPQSVLEIVG